MSLVSISDLHIKSAGDEGHRLLSLFLDHELTKKAEHIFLLGDIFDFMVGNHKEYYEEYEVIFEKIRLHLEDKKIYFFEGNHDLCLDHFFAAIYKNHHFYYYKKPTKFNLYGKSFLFTHGDEINQKDKIYLAYRKIISSTPASILANHIIPYRLLNRIGKEASAASRRRSRIESKTGALKTNLRKQLENRFSEFDYVFAGHTHIKDEFEIPNSKGTIYLNGGMAQIEKCFIFFDGNKHQFIPMP